VHHRYEDAVVNPTLLVEVTSPSTEDYDRGDKLGHYKQLPSVLDVLLISHRRPQVTVVELPFVEARHPVDAQRRVL
jgi:Uma2 family endonuclease